MVPENFTAHNLHYRRIRKEHVPELVQAAKESFESLRQFYSPAWSKLSGLPTDEKLTEMISGWITEGNDVEGVLYVVYNKNENLLGIGEYHHIDWSVPKGRIGYWIRKGKEGKGYATEIARCLTKLAFEDLGFARLEIRSEIRNPASRRIAEKLGYKYIGVFEKNKKIRDGEYWDLDIFAITDLKCLNT